MSLTLYQFCSNALNNAGLSVPTTIVGNTNPGAVRVLQLARRALRAYARYGNWTELVVEHTFDADGTGSDFPLPPDFRSIVDDTMWDRSRYWRMRGAMSPQQWQMYKSSSLGQATVEQRWRIKLPAGAAVGAPTMFSIDPALGSADRSQFVFEYVSDHPVRTAATLSLEEAKSSAPGTGYAIGDFITLAGGTFTQAAVVQVASLTNDGTGVREAEVTTPGVYTVAPASPAIQGSTTGTGTGASFIIDTVTMAGTMQADWTADTDTTVLDDDIFELGLIWRVLARSGFSYAEEQDEYNRAIDLRLARDGGTAILNLSPILGVQLISPWNIIDGNFPGMPT